MKTAIVVGGGLAGLVTARALARSGGFRPIVLESKPILGGLAASWRDAGGSLVETGLHVCFPYYRYFLGMLEELGAAAGIEWGHPTFSYVRTGGDVAQLRFPSLPAPLHGAIAIARHGHLSILDRISAVLGAVEATLSSAGWRRRYESMTFVQWAAQRGFSSELITGVFEPMIGGLTFLRGDQVSARAMLDYINAVGGRADFCRVGLFKAGVGEVVIDPVAADVTRRGGEIRTGCPVATLDMESGKIAGVRLLDGTRLRADVVIAAVPCHAIGSMLPSAVLDHPALRKVTLLRPVPVASALIWFDRPVGGPAGLRFSPRCAFNTWVDMAELLPELAGSNRSVLQLVVAPLDGMSTLDDAALAACVVGDIRRVLPAARTAIVEKVVMTRTPQSFHAVVPGAESQRPEVNIGIPGLLLAGDYVRTGHSPCMESAVVSGLRAAAAAIEGCA